MREDLGSIVSGGQLSLGRLVRHASYFIEKMRLLTFFRRVVLSCTSRDNIAPIFYFEWIKKSHHWQVSCNNMCSGYL